MKSKSWRSTPFGRALANFGWLLTGKGVGAVLSVVYLALAARSLPVNSFGQFMLILSTAQAIAALVGFQTWQIVVRYGIRAMQTGERDMLGRLVRFCIGLDLVGGLAGCAIAAGTVVVMQAHFGWSDALATQALLFCVVLLLSVRSSAVGILRLHDRFALGAMTDAVTPIARFAGAVVVVVAGASVTGFLIAWAIAEILTAVFYWIGAQRTAPGLIRNGHGARKTPREHPGLWRFALTTNVNATLSAATRQFVVVLVGFATGPAAAGNYRLAYQLSQSLVRLSDMFARGVFPELARADAGTSDAELRLLSRQSTRLAVAAGLAICVLAPLAGKPILWAIAGETYLGAYPILVLLSLAAGLEVMAVGFEVLLVSTGRAGAALTIRCVAVAVLGLVIALFLPVYGAIAAGAGALAASAVGLVLFARAAGRRIP